MLVIGDREGLIGQQMFVIDGVKLPGNASKARSGLRADSEREAVEHNARRNHRAAARTGLF